MPATFAKSAKNLDTGEVLYYSDTCTTHEVASKLLSYLNIVKGKKDRIVQQSENGSFLYVKDGEETWAIRID